MEKFINFLRSLQINLGSGSVAPDKSIDQKIKNMVAGRMTVRNLKDLLENQNDSATVRIKIRDGHISYETYVKGIEENSLSFGACPILIITGSST